jgi:peptidoglycan LD-endopeptidase LytH
MMEEIKLEEWLKKIAPQASPIVPFDNNTDKLLALDFTTANLNLSEAIFNDINLFSQFVAQQLNNAGCVYGIGGYNELRTVYGRSNLFDSSDEPRRLHLGIDIWGKAGTPIMAPIGGMVHSVAFNDNDGDYGATIILAHQLQGISFYGLYGHLSLADIQQIEDGNYINGGKVFAHFGKPEENGNWPPHLHFQLIKDIGLAEGDYPGVCKWSERDFYLQNCPDPDLLLQMMALAIKK